MSKESKNCPSWKSEYPVKQSEEHSASRRTFAKFLGLSAVALAGGSFAKDKLFTLIKTGEPKAVAMVADIQVGEGIPVMYPSNTDPCLLIRLSENEYVAYDQRCTHLQCPVHYNHQSGQIICPCHAGFFNAKDGSVIAGPPPRALPSYRVTVENGQIILG